MYMALELYVHPASCLAAAILYCPTHVWQYQASSWCQPWSVQLVEVDQLMSDRPKQKREYRKGQKLKNYSLHDKHKVIHLIEKGYKTCDSYFLYA